MMAIGVLFRRVKAFFMRALLVALAPPVDALRADDTLMMRNGTKVVGHIESVSDDQVIVTSTTPNGGVAKIPVPSHRYPVG